MPWRCCAASPWSSACHRCFAAGAVKHVNSRSCADAAWLQALLPVAAELFRVHAAGTLQAELQDQASLQPYVHLMAVLIVAARLCYQLDGSPRAHLPEVPPQPDWQGWARGVLACLRRQCALPLDAREARPWLPRTCVTARLACQRAQRRGLTPGTRLTSQAARWGPAEVKEYMQALQRTSLAGHQVPDGLLDFQRSLLASAKRGGDEPAAAGAAGDCTRTEPGAPGGPLRTAQPPLTLQTLVCFKQAIKNWQMTVLRAPAARVVPAEERNDDVAGSPLYRLWGPPHHPVSKHVHSDYAALLTVGAAYIWVKPDFLHALVCSLEMAMADTELEAEVLALSMSDI